MFPTGWTRSLKILLVMQKDWEVSWLLESLQQLEHVVKHCSDMDRANQLLETWSPDMLVVDDNLGRLQPNAGLTLAERHRATRELGPGRPQTQAIVLIPTADWDRFQTARRTGAHVIVKGSNFEKVIRYVQVVADELTTDRSLGPILLGVHGFLGNAPQRDCSTCKWIGSSIAYCRSEADVDLPPVRATLLNVLMLHRRGQSPINISETVNGSHFLRRVLGKDFFLPTAVKMAATLLRGSFQETLEELGVPYSGAHFLPCVKHGMERYRLAGNWQLVHIPQEESHAVSMAKGG